MTVTVTVSDGDRHGMAKPGPRLRLPGGRAPTLRNPRAPGRRCHQWARNSRRSVPKFVPDQAPAATRPGTVRSHGGSRWPGPTRVAARPDRPGRRDTHSRGETFSG
eukprot:388701-Hanusia_phi.AAC.2